MLVSQINQRALLHVLTASHWQYVIDLKHHINDPMCLKVLLLDGRETYYSPDAIVEVSQVIHILPMPESHLRPGCHCGAIPSESVLQ